MTLFTHDESSSSSSSSSSNSQAEGNWPNKYDGFSTIASSYEYTLSESTELSILQHQTSTTEATKRYQTKMLLASLIEHFCRTYGDTPEANRKVFFLICQTLRSLGIIDAEFVDEMSSVRSSFQHAFQKLFYTAVQTVNKSQGLLRCGEKQKMIEETDYFSLSPEPSSAGGPVTTTTTNNNTSNNITTTTTGSNGRRMSANSLFGNLSIQNSRYNHDFVEINLLGKGGFASAFRARNKLDGIDYAVKKIRLGDDIEDHGKSDDNPYEKIFREIKNLARLEHVNVIRYYSSWLEFDEQPESESDEEEEEEDDVTFSNDTYEESGMSQIMFTTTESSNGGMSNITFAESSGYEAGGNESSISASQQQQQQQQQTVPSSSSSKNSQSGWTLFIQMQLCPTTLHDYIKLRNKQYAENPAHGIDMKRNIEIFSQILQGTAYIHDQGLIHRDLKPSNIFLSTTYNNNGASEKRRSGGSNGLMLEEESWVPKIGDFGLAAEVMDEADGLMIPSLPSSPKLRHKENVRRGSVYEGRPSRPRPKRTRTVGVGTRTYASPEQLAVPVQPYDEKVDIYSLGIILFELFQPFATGMERADSLEKLKEGVFPKGFLEKYPKVSALILWMMDRDPVQRPSAHQLLEFELFSQVEEHEEYLGLQSQLEHKTQIIDELKKTVKRVQQEKQDALIEMQKKLDALQLQLDKYLKKPSPPPPHITTKKEVRWS